MGVTWTIWGKLLAGCAVAGALLGVSWLVARWFAVAGAAFESYCRTCGEQLGITTVRDTDGHRFCSLTCKTRFGRNRKAVQS